MPTAEKANVIERTKDKYQRAAGVVFTEYRGLKVRQLQELRKQLRAKGGEFQIVKNTLFKLATGEDARQLPEAMTSGPTAVAFIYENESECAKVLFDYAKANKALVVKGAFLGGEVFDDKQVEALSKLPSREVLIAQVLGAITAPLSNLVGVIEALYADPIRVIGAVADKVGEGAPAPAAPAAEPAPEPAQAEETAAEPVAESAAEPEATEEAPAEEAVAEPAAEEPPAETAEPEA